MVSNDKGTKGTVVMRRNEIGMNKQT